MKIILNKLINSRQVLQSMSNINIAPHLAYQITKFLIKSQDEEEFYNNRLRALFDECAQKNEDGTFITTDDGQGIKLQPNLIEKFNKSYEELVNTEIEAPDIKFALSEITKELTSISVNQMMTLMDFIDEDK